MQVAMLSSFSEQQVDTVDLQSWFQAQGNLRLHPKTQLVHSQGSFRIRT